MAFPHHIPLPRDKQHSQVGVYLPGFPQHMFFALPAPSSWVTIPPDLSRAHSLTSSRKYYLPWLPDLKSQPCQHLQPCLLSAASHIKQTRHYICLIDSGLPRWNFSPIRMKICLICPQLCPQQVEQSPTHSRWSINNIA